MKRKSIIESLYDMYLDGNEGIPVTDHCKEKKKEAYERYRMLREKLSPELAEELEVLMDIQLEMMPEELEESFSTGFRTGARLMCEIFQKDMPLHRV